MTKVPGFPQGHRELWFEPHSEFIVGDGSMPPDFYKSEDASALILENLRNPEPNIGMRLQYRTAFRVWEVSWFNFSFESPDRKTAIAEAGYQVAMAERAAKEKNG
jgi:hypothetical protein